MGLICGRGRPPLPPAYTDPSGGSRVSPRKRNPEEQPLTAPILPEPGERLEFGKHRMKPKDAEAAPAWPSPTEVELRRDRERGLRKGD